VSLLKPIITEGHGHESLASFLLRNKLLLGDTILEWLTNSSLTSTNVDYTVLYQHLVNCSSLPISINNSTQKAESICCALSIANEGTDYKELTLSSYKRANKGHYLTPKLKKQLSWCSDCLDEWGEFGIGTHLPLSWLLQGNHSCKVHKKPFSSSCPTCGTSYTQLNIAFMTGKCGRCDSPLTESGSKIILGQMELMV
jgi:hypothetical protein